MAENDLKLETRFTRSRGVLPYVAGAVGVLLIVVIVLTMTTSFADWVLPMEDRFLDVLVPTAPDGSEALSLRLLSQQLDAATLAVEGQVMNRTASTITGLEVAVEVKDKYTLPSTTVAVPVEPKNLAPGATGTFHVSVNAGPQGIGGYSVQFRLPNEGPIVPHRDDRSPDPIPAEKAPRK